MKPAWPTQRHSVFMKNTNTCAHLCFSSMRFPVGIYNSVIVFVLLGAPLLVQMVKNLLTMQTWVWSLSWEDPQRREWQPTPIFLPGKSHGQRSLVGCSSWIHKESDKTGRLPLSLSCFIASCFSSLSACSICW